MPVNTTSHDRQNLTPAASGEAGAVHILPSSHAKIARQEG